MTEEEKGLPVITTSGTSGLTSILQFTEDTPNEVFTIIHSTSGTETVLIVKTPAEEEGPTEEAKEE